MINWKLHEDRARQIWRVLAKHANQNRKPLTYKELGGKVNQHWRHLSRPLGVIQRHCKRGAPLQALAVNAHTTVPGAGYHATSTDKKAHSKAVMTVHGKKWDVKPPSRWKNSLLKE